MFPKIIISAILVFGLAIAPQWASAENFGSSQDSQSGFELSQASSLSAEALGGISGGYTVNANISSAEVNSQVSSNSIGSIGTTGEVFGNSVSNNSGLTTFIANSGNQVSISQSTSIQINIY